METKGNNVIELFQDSAKQGYIIAICTECRREVGRFLLHEDTDHFAITCSECGEKCLLVGTTIEQMKTAVYDFEEY